MPSEDLLSEKRDPVNLQGFGAFGDRMDRFKVIAHKIADEIIAKASPIVDANASATSSKEGSGEAKGKEPDKSGGSLGPALPQDETGAPLFELRQLSSANGPPGSWATSANDIWDLYRRALAWEPPAEQLDTRPKAVEPDARGANDPVELGTIAPVVRRRNVFVRFFRAIGNIFR